MIPLVGIRSVLGEQERRGSAQEVPLTVQLKRLRREKGGLVRDIEQRQAELDRERERSEEMVQKLEGLERANEDLKARVEALEAAVAQKGDTEETLGDVILALEVEKKEHTRTISSLKRDLSYAREEMQTAQAQCAMELEAATAKNKLLSQQIEDEEAAREAERVRLLKERLDRKQQFEGARRMLNDRIAALAQNLEAKEMDCIKLGEELGTMKREKDKTVGSLQRELEEAKEEAKKQIDSLHETLENVKHALEAVREGHVRTISSLEQDLSYTKEEMQNTQMQYSKDLEAATAENRLLSQQVEDEKAARAAERAQSLKERSDQQQRFEGTIGMLNDRVAALVQSLEVKALDCVKLEEDLATVRKEKVEAVASVQREMEEVKEEAKKQIDSLHETLENVKYALEALKEGHIRTISSLEQDLSYAKEEMQNAQMQYSRELEAATAENRLLSQQVEGEKAAREAERAQSLKERSDQQKQFEGAGRATALVQDLQAKLQQELDSAKEETKKQIDSLNDKLDELKEESDSKAQRAVALEKEKAGQCAIM